VNLHPGDRAKVWRTRDVRGHVSPELTTWYYLVPLGDRTVIGYADGWREACLQVADELRRATA
jgi:hypothetical protein